MRVFLTGATDLIGSAIVPELLHAGHQVLGLTRSEAGANFLRKAGADVHQGNLTDLESLRSGAAQSDAVIHCAFNHDSTNWKESSEEEKGAIAALGSSLAGSNRLLIVSSGLGLSSPTRPVTEDVDPPADSSLSRSPELAAQALIPQGVAVNVVCLPQVHNTLKQGLVTFLIAIAREKGVSAYIAEGSIAGQRRMSLTLPISIDSLSISMRQVLDITQSPKKAWRFETSRKLSAVASGYPWWRFLKRERIPTSAFTRSMLVSIYQHPAL